MSEDEGDVFRNEGKGPRRLTKAEKEALLKKVAGMDPDKREKLLRVSKPRIVQEFMPHIPHPKQQAFLGLKCTEAMYGGSAGGGKSDALLMAASQYYDVPGYSALILRRTWPDLASPGAILDRANTWYQGTRARKREGGRTWEFPTFDENGKSAQPARLTFGTILREDDKFKFASSEHQFIGFDELTHFESTQYTFMFSRLRKPALTCLSCGGAVRRCTNPYKSERWEHSPTGTKNTCQSLYPDPGVLNSYPTGSGGLSIFDVPLRTRSATNPGSRGHSWVKERFIDPKTREKNAVFLPSSLADNPSIDHDAYVQSLMHLNPVDRQRLLDGDWDVAEVGEMFERHWFKVIREAPRAKNVVRFWDRAATKNDGDWTVGVKAAMTEHGIVIMDVVRGQWTSAECEKVIAQVAGQDGRFVPVRMEQEPGSAGVDVISNYRRRILPGYNFDGIRSTGSKVERAATWAGMAQAGDVYLVAAQWNKAFVEEATLFPIGQNDDQVDATSGAVNFLALNQRGRLLA